MLQPLLLLVGLGTIQAALLYHHKIVLNYATFEAARAGALHHASPEAMRRALGERLAPVFGGDGQPESAMAAIEYATELVQRNAGFSRIVMGRDRPVPDTRLVLHSPTLYDFRVFGQNSVQIPGLRVIPNAHLEHQPLNGNELRQLLAANELDLEVVHAVPLQIPWVDHLFSLVMQGIDPVNADYYKVLHIPVTARSVVRMQSEVWLSSVIRVLMQNNAVMSGASVPAGGY